MPPPRRQVHECVQPFQSLAYPLEPEELLEIARFHARKAAVHVAGVVRAQPRTTERERAGRDIEEMEAGAKKWEKERENGKIVT